MKSLRKFQIFLEKSNKGRNKKEVQQETEPLNGYYAFFSLSGMIGMAPF